MKKRRRWLWLWWWWRRRRRRRRRSRRRRRRRKGDEEKKKMIMIIMMMMKKKKKKKKNKNKNKKQKKKKKGSHSLSTNSGSVRNTIFISPKPLQIVTCSLHKSYKMKPTGEVVSVHPSVYVISVTTQSVLRLGITRQRWSCSCDCITHYEDARGKVEATSARHPDQVNNKYRFFLTRSPWSNLPTSFFFLRYAAGFDGAKCVMQIV